jgi:hypothetical protein
MPKTKASNNNDKNIYFVESILDKRVQTGRIEYLIKWEGYDEQHNSWEPKKNVSSVLIKEFENNMTQNDSKTKKTNSNNNKSLSKIVKTNKKVNKVKEYDNIQKEDVFIVDEILEKRVKGKTNQVEYLIKWEGFGNEYNTWEPKKNVSQKLVKQFEEKLLKMDKQETENTNPSDPKEDKIAEIKEENILIDQNYEENEEPFEIQNDSNITKDEDSTPTPTTNTETKEVKEINIRRLSAFWNLLF